MKSVLIGEDSSVIQNLTKKILAFQNYEIFSAKNGKEVMAFLEKNTPTVILLDINMPIMNGIDCVKSIRSMEDTTKAAIPVIAITGNAANHSIDYLLSIGFSEYLQKPLNFDTLVTTVNKFANTEVN
jgi:CheY-like chemotaxis protein